MEEEERRKKRRPTAFSIARTVHSANQPEPSVRAWKSGKGRASVSTPNYALKSWAPGSCGAVPAPAKPSVSPSIEAKSR